MQHGQLAVRILEADILELNSAGKTFRSVNRIRLIHDDRLGIVDFHNLVRRRRESLELVHNVSQLPHRVCNRPDQSRKCDVLTHGDLRVDDEDTADRQKDYRHQVGEGLDIRIVDQPCHCRLLVRPGILLVALVESLDLIVFPCKRLDDTVAGDILLRRRIHLRQLFTQRLMSGRDLVLE